MTRSRLRRLIAGGTAVVVIVGAALGLWRVGAFDDAGDVATPLAKAGDRIQGEMAAVTVHDAEVTHTLPGQDYPAPDGQVYLVVHATVENVEERWSISAIGEVRATVRGLLDQNDQADIRDARNVQLGVAYQPHVPMEIAYVWTLDEGDVEPGEKFWVGVYQRKHKLDDPVFGSSALTGPQAVAVVDLTMQDGG